MCKNFSQLLQGNNCDDVGISRSNEGTYFSVKQSINYETQSGTKASLFIHIEHSGLYISLCSQTRINISLHFYFHFCFNLIDVLKFANLN